VCYYYYYSTNHRVVDTTHFSQNQVRLAH
jgi:hypothetical protein